MERERTLFKYGFRPRPSVVVLQSVLLQLEFPPPAMKASTILGLLAAASSAAAHATFQELAVNGVDKAGTCVRQPSSNSPITSPTSAVSLPFALPPCLLLLLDIQTYTDNPAGHSM